MVRMHHPEDVKKRFSTTIVEGAEDGLSTAHKRRKLERTREDAHHATQLVLQLVDGCISIGLIEEKATMFLSFITYHEQSSRYIYVD